MAILKDLKLSDLVAKDQDVTNLSVELKGDVEASKTYSQTLVNNLSITLKNDIATSQTAAEAHADTVVYDLSAKIKEDIATESQSRTSEDERLDDRIDELSNELSNYWKVKKDDEDPSKKVSEEMDFLMMRAQGNPNVVYKIGVPYQDSSYSEDMIWKYYGTSLATDFIQSGDGNVNAEDGTTVQTMNVGS